MTESAIECAVSATSAPDPVTYAAMAFVIAIARFPGVGPQFQKHPRDLGLAHGKGVSIPQRRRHITAEAYELVLAIRLRVLEVDPRLQPEVDDPRPDARARRLGDAMEQGVLAIAHFAARGRRS